jgi:phosphomannomutase
MRAIFGCRYYGNPGQLQHGYRSFKLFPQVVRTRIGSPYVIAGMEEAEANGSQSVAGFEANGGFLAGKGLRVGEHELAALPTRDAVLPALALLAMAKQQGVKLSAFSNHLPNRYTASDRLQDFATKIAANFWLDCNRMTRLIKVCGVRNWADINQRFDRWLALNLCQWRNRAFASFRQRSRATLLRRSGVL